MPVAKVAKLKIQPSTTVLANQSTNEANSEATVNHQGGDGPTNGAYTYAPRVRERAVQDPGAHNFPYSFDQEILKTRPIKEVDGSNTYILSGSMNDKNGFFILGVNERTKTIFHRSFETKYILFVH